VGLAVNDTAAAGVGPQDDLQAALNHLERYRDAAIAEQRQLFRRRARVARELFAGGSMRRLAIELGVARQTIVNDVAHFAAHGIRVPTRRADRRSDHQEQLPVGGAAGG